VAAGITLWTIGHPAADLEVFLGYLREAKIERVIDVPPPRCWGRSGHLPRFGEAGRSRFDDRRTVAGECVTYPGI